jgi:hypothetical protein
MQWQLGISDQMPAFQTFSGWNPPPIVFSTWGDHYVSLTIEENGCEDTFRDTVRIYRRPRNNVSVENQIGCAPFTVDLLGQHDHRWTSHLQLGFWGWRIEQ